MKSKGFKLLRGLWSEQSEDEIENYISILKETGALTAVLIYYSAAYKIIKRAGSEQILGNIKVPTLFIRGTQDAAIGSVSVEGSHKYMNTDYTFLELKGGHWLLQTHYKKVKEAIAEHLEKFKDVHK